MPPAMRTVGLGIQAATRASRTAQAVNLAKSLATDAVKLDQQGAISQAVLGYRKSLEQLGQALKEMESAGESTVDLRKFAGLYQDRVQALTGDRPMLNLAPAAAPVQKSAEAAAPAASDGAAMEGQRWWRSDGGAAAAVAQRGGHSAAFGPVPPFDELR